MIDAAIVEGDLALGEVTAVDVEQTTDHPQCRGLPGAVGAEEGHDLAVGDLEGDAAQHEDDVGVDHFDVLQRQHATRSSRRSRRAGRLHNGGPPCGRMPDAGYRIPDARCRMPDTGWRMPDAGCRMPDGRHGASLQSGAGSGKRETENGKRKTENGKRKTENYPPPTHSSPPSPCSFFQIGADALSSSMRNRAAANGSGRCPAETATPPA